jgi:predicted enzyme related to lactoylglutathione lyase
MLGDAAIRTTIPVADINRAVQFYKTKLGLKPLTASMPGIVIFAAGNGGKIELYQRSPTKADHTVATFEVDDIESTVSSLARNGVAFENYDIPSSGIKTVNGIATMGEMKAAWFKDTEGNILCIHQNSAPGR